MTSTMIRTRIPVSKHQLIELRSLFARALAFAPAEGKKKVSLWSCATVSDSLTVTGKGRSISPMYSSASRSGDGRQQILRMHVPYTYRIISRVLYSYRLPIIPVQYPVFALPYPIVPFKEGCSISRHVLSRVGREIGHVRVRLNEIIIDWLHRDQGSNYKLQKRSLTVGSKNFAAFSFSAFSMRTISSCEIEVVWSNWNY